MEKKHLRKVKIRTLTGVKNGYFHQWGTISCPTDDGRNFGITCGIIELENGEVKEVEPTVITFVDSF